MNTESSDLEWPLKKLSLIYVLSILHAGMLLPSLDGPSSNKFRLPAYGALSVIYWVRVIGAVRRKEKGRGYIPYVILIFAGQLLIWPLNDWIMGR